MDNNSSYRSVIDTLCKRLKKEQIPEKRIYIIQILQEIGDEKSLLSLAEATKDENDNVRQAALQALRTSEIIKVKFLSYLKDFCDSQETIQDILKKEAILERVGKTVFSFKMRGITMTNNPKINQNFYDSVGAAVGNVQGDFIVTGNVISNSDSNLRDIGIEIKLLLEKLSTTYPTNTSKEKMVVVGEAVEQIESNPPLKAKVINALKSGGKEAFKEAIDHPLVNILLASIEGWTDGQ